MNKLFHQISSNHPSLSSLRFLSSSLSSPHNTLNSQTPIQNDHTPKFHTTPPKPLQTNHPHPYKPTLPLSPISLTNSTIEFYCKTAKMEQALHLFDEMPQRNLITWNIIISGYNNFSQYEECWEFFCRMWGSSVYPDQFTYGSVLSACGSLQDIRNGTQVYSLVLKNGFFTNGYVRTGMIDLFAKSFCFEEALRVFRDVFCENVVCWNSIISASVRNNENFAALDIFKEMVSWDLRPNGYTYPSVLTACRVVGETDTGKGVHGRVIKCGFEEDVFVGTAIVDFYTKCGDIRDAVEGFSRMVVRNVVSWTAIISGFVQRGDSESAINLFKEMRQTGVEVNNYTLTSVLTACANPQMKTEAIQIHSLCVKCAFNLYPAVIDSLINMYAKIGEIVLSELVFRESEPSQNVDTWAVMISGFVLNRSSGRAFHLFRRMTKEGIRPNTSCTSSLLSSLDCIYMGRQIHGHILKDGLVSDVSVGSALFTMYSKCDCLEEAYDIFEQIREKDRVSWTSMLAGFAEHGFAEQAFHIYHRMVLEDIQPDETTLSSILTACSVLPSLQKGKEVHAYALHAGWGKNTLVGGGLVTMYSKSGALASASRVFKLMDQKDMISRSSLISGYAQNGCVEDSLLLYREMLVGDMVADSFAISSLLGMATNLTILDLGKQLHTHVVKMGIFSDPALSNTLMIMYSKCGNIEDSHHIFIQIENPDVFTWTSIIMAFALHGKGNEALQLYDLMRIKGVDPDSVTFSGVLSACSHNGLVEEGYSHLKSMTKNYGIMPNSHHYACMVDLLGRSGSLEEAEKLIASMPIKPDALIWGTLLAACKVHGNIELARLAAKRIFELEPTDAGAYVSLSNISADMGQWGEVINIRSLMNDVGVTKEPGESLIEATTVTSMDYGDLCMRQLELLDARSLQTLNIRYMEDVLDIDPLEAILAEKIRRSFASVLKESRT